MAFVWVYTTSIGVEIRSEEVQEIRNHMSTLNTNIMLPPPTQPSITFSQPLADWIVTQDEVIDEIQANLNTLKSENYCRGYFSAECVSDNVSDQDTVYYNQCSTHTPSGYDTRYNDEHSTEHNGRNGTRNSTNEGTDRDARYDTNKSGEQSDR
jgi:hypothetical protein